MTTQINSLQHYKEVYQDSINDPENFWAQQAESFQWFKPWSKVLQWNFDDPEVKWF